MSIEQRLRNLGIDPDLSGAEIKKHLEKIIEQQRAEEAKTMKQMRKT
jgi:hypothetical protein